MCTKRMHMFGEALRLNTEKTYQQDGLVKAKRLPKLHLHVRSCKCVLRHEEDEDCRVLNAILHCLSCQIFHAVIVPEDHMGTCRSKSVDVRMLGE